MWLWDDVFAWARQNFDGKTFFDADAKQVNYTVEELTEVFAFVKRLLTRAW